MGYAGEYTIWARCLSECFATLTFVFFALCLLANKLLPKTKAHDLTYGWLAFGIGIVIVLPVQFLGFISSFMNPAVALAFVITGKISLSDWVFIAVSELFGAFLGAVGMWVFYLPQFETAPEPPLENPQDRLLHTTDDIGVAGLDFVSYTTGQGERAIQHGAGILELGRMMSGMRNTPTIRHRGNRNAEFLRNASIQASGRDGRRYSSSVVDVDRHPSHVSQSIEMSVRAKSYCDDSARFGQIKVCVHSPRNYMERSIRQSSAQQHCNLWVNKSSQNAACSGSNVEIAEVPQAKLTLCEHNRKIEHDNQEENINYCENKKDLKFAASIVADQNMKLSIFCTRPAHFFPISNLITEIISTFYLAIGILFIKERSELFAEYGEIYKHGFFSLFVGLLIFVLILCLGGMGIAMNPARDLAPRFAHFILPVHGKGVSEWYYSWIPILGPIGGGALAGGIFNLILHINTYDP